MVAIGNMKRGEMDGNRASTSMLEGHGKKIVKIRGNHYAQGYGTVVPDVWKSKQEWRKGVRSC